MNIGSLKDLKPFLEVIGSIAEGTRIALANELDLNIKFRTLMSHTSFKVEKDPFSLKKSETVPPIMEQFFTGSEFKFHKFMRFLLDAVDNAINEIFETNKNPTNLKRVTTNKDWKPARLGELIRRAG